MDVRKKLPTLPNDTFWLCSRDSLVKDFEAHEHKVAALRALRSTIEADAFFLLRVAT